VSGMSLVVKQGSLSDMESAMTTAHDEIVSQVKDVLEQVNSRIQGWDPSTASRTAEMDYQHRLEAGVEKLAKALDTVRAKLADVATAAHEAEVENVAIVD
jgi:uncharacterized protein YukE